MVLGKSTDKQDKLISHCKIPVIQSEDFDTVSGKATIFKLLPVLIQLSLFISKVHNNRNDC